MRRGSLAFTTTVRAARAPWSVAADSSSNEPYAAVRARALALLRERGADGVAHLGGDLLSHLERTEAILREWDAGAAATEARSALG